MINPIPIDIQITWQSFLLSVLEVFIASVFASGVILFINNKREDRKEFLRALRENFKSNVAPLIDELLSYKTIELYKEFYSRNIQQKNQIIDNRMILLTTLKEKLVSIGFFLYTNKKKKEWNVFKQNILLINYILYICLLY